MRRAFPLLAIAFLCGCSTELPTSHDTVTRPDLTRAPTAVALGGQTVTLETSLWRDFMPIAPPGGRGLTALLRIKTQSGEPVPDTITADMVWVLFGSDVWSALVRQERTRDETKPAYELVARDGPQWGPDVTVDVVIRLRERNGSDVLLRAANQPIRGTF